MISSRPSEPASALLVGRVNVGKSTLFNRILNRHLAITSPEANTTRDLNRALVSWRAKSFWLIDSGGFNFSRGDVVAAASAEQMKRALNRAGVILLVVDGQVGLTPEDRELAKRVRQTKAHIILVINKIDSPTKRRRAENLSLGFADTVMVSAQNGSGIGDLLDLIVQNISPAKQPSPNLKAAFLGQTNVGKSSLFNALLKTERSLVLPTPHTTRDKLHDYIETGRLTVEIIDTAGIRRNLGKTSAIEKQSIKQSLMALKQIDLALITIDGTKSPSWQDQHLGQLVTEARVACLVLITKADLVKSTQERKAINIRLSRWLPMLSWAPLVWTSAKSGEGLDKVITLCQQACTNRRRRLTQPQLEFFWRLLKNHRLTHTLPIQDFTQLDICPPTFALTLRQKTSPPPAIGDWVTRQLRQKFDFTGTPIFVKLESRRQART